MAKLPTYTAGFDEKYFYTWTVWLFFFIIPEDCHYQLLKTFGMLSAYITHGYTKGIPGKEKTNLRFLQKTAEDYAEEASYMLGAGELPDAEGVLELVEALRVVYSKAEYAENLAAKEEYIHLTDAAKLIGRGFRSLFLDLWTEEIPLFKNKYSYLYMRRDDLEKLM